MDLNGAAMMMGLLIGAFALIGFANLLDFGLRNVAESKAQRAEATRFAKWGLPAPVRKREEPDDRHLWHF